MAIVSFLLLAIIGLALVAFLGVVAAGFVYGVVRYSRHPSLFISDLKEHVAARRVKSYGR